MIHYALRYILAEAIAIFILYVIAIRHEKRIKVQDDKIETLDSKIKYYNGNQLNAFDYNGKDDNAKINKAYKSLPKIGGVIVLRKTELEPSFSQKKAAEGKRLDASFRKRKNGVTLPGMTKQEKQRIYYLRAKSKRVK